MFDEWKTVYECKLCGTIYLDSTKHIKHELLDAMHWLLVKGEIVHSISSGTIRKKRVHACSNMRHGSAELIGIEREE